MKNKFKWFLVEGDLDITYHWWIWHVYFKFWCLLYFQIRIFFHNFVLYNHYFYCFVSEMKNACLITYLLHCWRHPWEETSHYSFQCTCRNRSKNHSDGSAHSYVLHDPLPHIAANITGYFKFTSLQYMIDCLVIPGFSQGIPFGPFLWLWMNECIPFFASWLWDE